MKIPSLLAAGALALVPPLAACDTTGPVVGDQAPAFEVRTWFNHLGPALDAKALRGRAVLVELWATW